MSTNISEEIFFCPHTFDVYLCTPVYDRPNFPFVYKFSSFYCWMENFIVTCGLTVKILWPKISEDKYHVS